MKCWCTVAERAILIEHNLVRKSGEEEEVIRLVVGEMEQRAVLGYFVLTIFGVGIFRSNSCIDKIMV